MTLEEFEDFVIHAEWTFAKTMPDIPHEYTLKKNNPRDVFKEAVEFIREKGDVRLCNPQAKCAANLYSHPCRFWLPKRRYGSGHSTLPLR